MDKFQKLLTLHILASIMQDIFKCFTEFDETSILVGNAQHVEGNFKEGFQSVHRRLEFKGSAFYLFFQFEVEFDDLVLNLLSVRNIENSDRNVFVFPFFIADHTRIDQSREGISIFPFVLNFNR